MLELHKETAVMEASARVATNVCLVLLSIVRAILGQLRKMLQGVYLNPEIVMHKIIIEKRNFTYKACLETLQGY